jgi:hypothetical protein
MKELAVFMKEPGSLEGSFGKFSKKNEDSKFHTKISFSKKTIHPGQASEHIPEMITGGYISNFNNHTPLI